MIPNENNFENPEDTIPNLTQNEDSYEKNQGFKPEMPQNTTLLNRTDSSDQFGNLIQNLEVNKKTLIQFF
ncbi:uncharacterized protein PMUG01_01013900 [Plasmodium malariae]|uniref:Uncharacterized protein n=1 Tax=Plasmodium malariae TaxID=5858 RepID=A0A1A8X204_PLAMA|nr:uncharacterized protein PMUG01_01013900 [Plasmodium malariae]SBS97750.1 conserved Plasmodium protein, unknown function [Plasmodium malariae]SBT86852.1 hypothetical protein PMUG01_01013900 [Plasmodium malariae]